MADYDIMVTCTSPPVMFINIIALPTDNIDGDVCSYHEIDTKFWKWCAVHTDIYTEHLFRTFINTMKQTITSALKSIFIVESDYK